MFIYYRALLLPVGQSALHTERRYVIAMHSFLTMSRCLARLSQTVQRGMFDFFAIELFQSAGRHKTGDSEGNIDVAKQSAS